jgi:hypothetical protein
VSENYYEAGFQPFFAFAINSWGFAPGWYGIAPLALYMLKIAAQERRRRGPYQPGAKPQG